MEKISYAEAREWFWVRTGVWSVPTLIVSAAAYFVYADGLVENMGQRVLLSLLGGLVATALALLAAWISTQFSWMRAGKWRAWPINAIACAVIAGIGAVAVGGVTLSVMRDNITNPPSADTLAATYDMLVFGICLSATVAAAFGAWFALRFDKYFLESI